MSLAAIPACGFLDCHHHVWDPGPTNPHPWLTDDPPIPFRYGDYASIRGRYLPADFARDAGAVPVTGHVTMEGEWDEADPVGETHWLEQVFACEPRYLGHVARAFLHRSDLEAVLAGHASHPFVKGIRHKPTAAPAPDRIERGVPGGMSDPAWLAGYRKLATFDLHFELQAPWWHVDELLDLIASVPQTPVVLNHAFMPSDRSDAGLSGWRKAIERAAAAPNVTIKISGIGVAGKPWTLEDQRPIIEACIAAFGPQRAMFASNFPVDRLCGDYETIIGGYAAAVADLPEADRRALFYETAARVYRLAVGQTAPAENA